MTQHFRIVSKPVAIEVECPHCGAEISIPWEAAKVPEYWGDAWEPVVCPDCGEEVELGNWDYD